ncbi:hypothetical protein [Bradyrhizobium arachidis]|nr:hypothetical protein [Bradyrhizobium arachidis]SFV01025.1 hypothetical protein SAMN05192541_109288 [Bradyrhizobium arachidis]
MKSRLRMIAGVVAVIGTPYSALAQDVLAQRYNVFIQHDKVSFIQKTIKELNTPEGRAVLSAAAAYLGVDPATVNAAIAGTADMVVPKDQQDSRGIIRSSEGYTICLAKPSNENMGAGQHGIETHGDTTFNTSLVRVIPGRNNDDGLVWYTVVPFKASTDTRVAGSFDVVFVKASPGWRERYPNCRPSGEHPWLARNNHTQLNVKCTVPQYCE